MFVIVSGSSGVGKNTVINNLKSKSDKFVLMPTYTTREMRPTEKEGEPYFYISLEEFQNKIRDRELIEYEYIHNNYYGSSYAIFEQYSKMGKIIIKDIGVEGAQNLCKKLDGKDNIVKFFLTVKHKSELKKRLKGRHEKDIKLRLRRFDYEQKQICKFDFVIYNNDLQETTKQIIEILNLGKDDFLPNVEPKKLNKYKIKYYLNKLKCGKDLKPVKIALQNGKAYIVSGVERYVASRLAKKPIAKVLTKRNIKKQIQTSADWCNKIFGA